MNHEIKPQHHVDIEDIQSIHSVSTGSVSKTTWSASDGYAREQAIQEARIQAHEEHLKAEAERRGDISNERLMMMEGAIARLQQDIKELQDAQVK